MSAGRWHCRLKLPALCALVIGLVLSCVLFLLMLGQQQQIERNIFERRTHSRIVALQQGVSGAIDTLRVVNQLFVTNDHVSREQFHTFTAPLLLRHAYIDTFAFSRLVTRDEREQFETGMGATFPGFVIEEIVDGKRKVAAAKDRYRVIDYLEPMGRENSYFGIDATSQASTFDAIRRAEDTGQPSATGLFKRTLGTGTQRGVRIMMAVYRKAIGTDGAPRDVAARRSMLIGYTVAVLHSGGLFEDILASADTIGNAGLDISIYASAAADESALVYGAPDVASRQLASAGWLTNLLLNRLQPVSHHFDVAGTDWRMVISAQPTPLAALHGGALPALLMGLLSTFAASAYLQSITLRAQQVQQLVAKRTDELKQLNAMLVRDINGRKQMEEALRDSRSQLRKLANHQESVKEDERKRIARDIHDELGQNLMALRIDVSMMANALAPVSQQWLETALQQIDATIKAVRTIINDLRPAVLDLGLQAALDWQVNEFKRRSGIACELQIEHDEFTLNDKHATALFRIVQEALTNILKHAKASEVQIRIQRIDDRLFVKIADDGIGCARKGRGFGLVGMEERLYALGGAFSIESNPGKGTSIMLSIPCDGADIGAAKTSGAG